jgi:GNAT superfamily N-acetyltransferase
VILRSLDSGDGFLLRIATWLNVNWCGERFTVQQVDADPRLAAYFRIAPDGGTFGWVATAQEAPVGVVWGRHFSADAPGFGFVRADVPELSVCVLPGYRGAGLGTALVGAAVTEAVRRSLPGLSLSVEDGNPARRLYERLGFAPVPSARQPGTLARMLDGEEPSPRR